MHEPRDDIALRVSARTDANTPKEDDHAGAGKYIPPSPPAAAVPNG